MKNTSLLFSGIINTLAAGPNNTIDAIMQTFLWFLDILSTNIQFLLSEHVVVSCGTARRPPLVAATHDLPLTSAQMSVAKPCPYLILVPIQLSSTPTSLPISHLPHPLWPTHWAIDWRSTPESGSKVIAFTI